MEDKGIFDKWNAFINALIEGAQDAVHKPLAWSMVLLIVIIFFSLYDLPQDKKKVRRSIVGLLRYALRVLLAFVEDLLSAIESVTGFVDVIRIILKGKLTDGVQFLLGNYAIIALSVASFFTTFNGLKKVVNGYAAALITFGIQVGILAMSSRLGIDLNKKNQQRARAFKEVDYFTKNSVFEVREGKEKATVFDDASLSYRWLVGPQSNKNGIKEEKQGGKIVRHAFLLAFSMIVSIYFSYVYFFESHVSPNLASDNYILTMNTIAEITDDYSAGLSEMHGILLGKLQEMNQQVRGTVDVAANQQIDSNIEEVQDRLDQEEKQRDEQVTRRSELDAQRVQAELIGDTEEQVRLESLLSDIQNSINGADERIEELRKELDSKISDRDEDVRYFDRKNIIEVLDELDRFYADPIGYMASSYIAEIENPEVGPAEGENPETSPAGGENPEAGSAEGNRTENAWRSEITSRFEDMMRYYSQNEDDETYKDGLTIFNNFASLCEYYQVHGDVGFNKELANSIDISDMAISGSDKNEGDELINQKSAMLLRQMMSELNRIPVMVEWNHIEPAERNVIHALSRTKDMTDLYKLYRVSMGKVDTLEMVLLKPIMDPSWLLAVIAFLAAFVDVLAVILTLVKGTIHYENKLPRYRKLLHKMFIQDTMTDKDKWAVRLMRWAGGLGVAFGLLVFGFYYRISGDEKGDIHQVVSLICFVSLGALISWIIVGLYRKTHEDAKDWKEEELYGRLRSAWNIQEKQTAEELREQILKADKKRTPLLVGEDQVTWIVQLLSDVESEDIVKALKPNARLLFRHIGMARLKKRTWEYYFVNQGLSSAKDYIQGWFDEIDFAYIPYEKVREHGMAFPFAVLRAEGLIAYFECEESLEASSKLPVETMSDNSAVNVYYILSGRFLKILYELIMEANTGTDFEDDSYIADDLADAYEAEEMTED